MHADQILQRGLEPSHGATMPEGRTLNADRSKLGHLRRPMLEIFGLQTHLFANIVILHGHDAHSSALLLELAHGNLVP
jgi:hypothetical protein